MRSVFDKQLVLPGTEPEGLLECRRLVGRGASRALVLPAGQSLTFSEAEVSKSRSDGLTAVQLSDKNGGLLLCTEQENFRGKGEINDLASLFYMSFTNRLQPVHGSMFLFSGTAREGPRDISLEAVQLCKTLSQMFDKRS